MVHLVFQSVALSRLAVERYPLRDSRASNSKRLRNGTASAPYVPLLPSWFLSMQSQKISVKWDLYRYIKVSEVWSMDDLAICCDHVFCRQRKRDRRNSVDAGGSCLRNHFCARWKERKGVQKKGTICAPPWCNMATLNLLLLFHLLLPRQRKSLQQLGKQDLLGSFVQRCWNWSIA